MNWAEFDFVDNTPERHFLMRPCLRILFFLDGDIATLSAGLKAFYQTALQILGKSCHYHFKQYQARYDSDGYLKHSKNSRATHSYFEDYLAGRKVPERFGIALETTESPYGISNLTFEIQHEQRAKRGFVSLVLPIDHFAQNFAELAKLADSIASSMPFHSGYAGYAVNIAFKNEALRRYAGAPVEKLAKKYSGVDFRLPSDLLDIEASNGQWQADVGTVSNVAWITYVGKKELERRPGIGAGEVASRALKFGRAFQLGEAPSPLAEENKASLGPYQSFARTLLKPDPARRILLLDVVGGEESTKQWLRRFL